MIGDVQDMLDRLHRVLPSSWFPSDDGGRPNLNASLQGYASQAAFIYDLIAELTRQTRLSTATGGFLDLAAGDFFGTALPRQLGQTDASYRSDILGELLAERGTRVGLRQAIQRLAGRLPFVIEPQSPSDCGAYASILVPATSNPSRLGYGIDGGTKGGYWGSILMDCQVLVRVRRAATAGIPVVIGYRHLSDTLSTPPTTGAYYSIRTTTQPGQPTFPLVPGRTEWGSLSQMLDFVTDAQICAAINANRPAGVTVWVRFEG